MIDIEQIIYINDDQYMDKVNLAAKDILNQYSGYNIVDNSDVSRLVRLKEFIYGTDDEKQFFRLLDIYGYNINFEVINFIRALDRIQLESVNVYENSPYIESIKTTGTTFTVQTTKRKILFTVATDYYDELKQRKFKLLKRKGNFCHKDAQFLAEKHPDLIVVTSLCRHMFGDGTYYHSYTLDEKNGKVIDPLYNFVMDKKTYDDLFNTEEVFRLKGSELALASTIAKRHNSNLITIDDVMACTLFQQYIWENELPSPDMRFYTKIPKNPSILIKNKWESRK